ncbi:hypothetical protein GOP47_0022935 [Adiantum capillus-veneris]|uniref:Major facilitator superfamily (MFS) profile domain-containing protein n=1 Tax=Adiantum capillus-veneris TaxID=13818 RepID=A0A9D4Z7C6_ADICA|nr:hypothetical protein GOP47_0022935 [Adiantum capillus-veneris]
MSMALAPRSRPLGIRLVQHLVKSRISYETYQASVLTLTFIAYSLYHLSRKPSSIVKNTLISLSREHPFIRRPNATHLSSLTGHPSYTTTRGLKGWAPFDGDSGATLMGEIDVAFLAVYAVGTFFAGHLGDRLCLRWILAVGMVGSGLFTCLFGFAYWWNVHLLAYFFIVQMLLGLFQATGWPSVVSVVANWFGKRKRGLIMGVWNAHTSFGNICGSLIASSLLEEGWGWAFVVPGMAVMAGGMLIFLFLVVDPSIVGFPSPHTHIMKRGESSHYNEVGEDEEAQKLHNEKRVLLPFVENPKMDAKWGSYEELPTNKDGFHEGSSLEGHLNEGEKGKLVENIESDVPLLVNYYGKVESSKNCEEVHPVGFLEALAIPGVVPFSLCLFFTKLVAYTFIYWLPFYISNTEIGGEYMSDEVAGNLSTLFDVGGVLGGAAAGHMSDRLNARATTAAFFTWGAIPAMAMYRAFGGGSMCINVGLLLLSGLFVNAPYSLITTAVSVDLGTHERVKGNARALATVAAIIDGTGSLGAALGPLFTGYISEAFGWNAVFVMLTISAFVSGALLFKQVSLELKARSSTQIAPPLQTKNTTKTNMRTHV